MSKKLSLSVILPIKSSKSKDFDIFFDKAIASLEKQEADFDELVIVHTKEDTLVKFLNEYDFKNLNVKKFEWDSEPNYCTQINYGVEKATSEWVSLFEFDDEYSNIWFKNFRK
jgi:glycosyltransferase involved in cell wall biosynthesis